MIRRSTAVLITSALAALCTQHESVTAFSPPSSSFDIQSRPSKRFLSRLLSASPEHVIEIDADVGNGDETTTPAPSPLPIHTSVARDAGPLFKEEERREEGDGALTDYLAGMRELTDDPEMPEIISHEYKPLIDSSDMGPDTMAFAASALSFMLQNLGKPVIFSGSQIPLREPYNDARKNLIMATIFASSDTIGINIEENEHLFRAPPRGSFRINTSMDTRMITLRLVPGFDDASIKAIIDAARQTHLKGLILQLYGTGNLPSIKDDFVQCLRDATDAGIVVVATTQCQSGSVILGHYATGQKLIGAGVVSGSDMSIEATTTKLAYLLGRQDLSIDEVRDLMTVDLRGEMTPESEMSPPPLASAYQKAIAKKNRTYQSISVDEESARNPRGPKRNDNRVRLMVIGFLVLALITTSFRALSRQNDDEEKAAGKYSSTTNSRHINVPMPAGVNLGSWLSLEDWFYVGDNGAVEVASPDDAIAAACLPPLHLDSSTGPRWNSETDLLSGLAQHYKEEMEKDDETQSTLGGYPNNKKQSLGPWGKAIKTIHAFRSSYLDFEKELGTMASLGIKHVRVPVSWCWTDTDIDPDLHLVTKNETDPNNDDNWIYMDDEEVLEKYTCIDPFTMMFVGQLFPGVCATFFACLCDHGLVQRLTFTPILVERLLGHLVVFGLVIVELGGQRSTCVPRIPCVESMNEPAHLATLYNGNPPIRTDRETFLPPLPLDKAAEYLNELNAGLESKPHLTKVPDGNHLRVMLWLRDAIDAFRQSSLPSMGKELHVNVHESLFPSEVLPKQEIKSDYGLNQAPMQLFGAWWRASTTPKERAKWAVLDIHHYYAWGSQCSGAVEGPPTGRFSCSDEEQRELVIDNCGAWASVYRSTIEKECE
ncbi:asparaginase [Skeletonema marinoi]|uniref:asparaginase n=1 Tax=Skeletonema marinoi TaxID=267567 RepID=A0AAD8Y005_9STRA|nr:asparaginase [Skeletonema marinoi]